MSFYILTAMANIEHSVVLETLFERHQRRMRIETDICRNSPRIIDI